MKLTEYDKIEWRSVVKRLKPDLSEEEYDKLWDDFIAMKNKRNMH